MRGIWRVGIAAALQTTALILLVAPLNAQSSTVSIGVGDTVLKVAGKTSPNAFVTISRGGGVIGTVTADSGGNFEETFPAQNPGLHQLSVYAHSSEGLNTDVITPTVNIAEHTTTNAEVFLPSTITVSDSDLDYGQSLQISGEASPLSTVTIYIDNTTYATAPTDSQGKWAATLATNQLSSGQHSFFSRVTDGLGAQSHPTSLRYFSIAPQLFSLFRQPRIAPKPIAAPLILYPTQNTTVDEPTVTVSGLAIANTQIELWDGSQNIGSVWSNGQGEWSTKLQLEPRLYALRARACINQRCSNFSPTINLTYNPKSPISPLQRPLHTINTTPTALTSNEQDSTTIRFRIEDGQPPYKVTVQWDDSAQPETTTHTSDDIALTHKYSKPGKYTVKIDIRDAQGRISTLFFTVHVGPGQTNLLLLGILGGTAIGTSAYLYIRHRRRKNKRL